MNLLCRLAYLGRKSKSVTKGLLTFCFGWDGDGDQGGDVDEYDVDVGEKLSEYDTVILGKLVNSFLRSLRSRLDAIAAVFLFALEDAWLLCELDSLLLLLLLLLLLSLLLLLLFTLSGVLSFSLDAEFF